MTTHGSPSFQASGVTLISESPSFDPQIGATYVINYNGTPSAIAALALSVQLAGARTTVVNPDGGPSTLTATFPRDPNQPTASETPLDRWDFGAEQYQVNIFSHPEVVREMERYAATPVNGPVQGSGIAEYQRLIKEAVSDGSTNPIGTAFPLAQIVYNLLSQGVEYWEFNRPTMRRVRTYSQTYIGAPQVVTPQQVVYTRVSLIASFAVPLDVQSRIPVDPPEAPRTGAVWGWRLRNQNSTLTRESRATRIEEVLDWDFGEWLVSPTIGQSMYILR